MFKPKEMGIILARCVGTYLASSLARLICSKYTSLELIIFSKDRPMQLDLLLRSLFKGDSSSSYSISILYHASEAKFQEGYKQLISIWSSQPCIKFVKERIFRSDVINILRGSKCSHVCFLVDDDVFVRDLDPDSIFQAMNVLGCKIFQLRLGTNIKYSYTKDCSVVSPLWLGSFKGMLKWAPWRSGDEWNYRFSLDGGVYPHSLCYAVSVFSSFHSPNTYESRVNQLRYVFPRYFCCGSAPFLFNACLNRVQGDILNRSGEYSVEFLNEYWLNRSMLTLPNYESGQFSSVHSEISPEFEPDDRCSSIKPSGLSTK